jgi:hypothetical protein
MMSPEQHNKYLGIAHLVFGGFHVLIGALVSLSFFLMFTGAQLGSRPGEANPAGFFMFLSMLFLLVFAVASIPSLVAGYALLKRKSWARVAAIIGGALGAMRFPLGTALCVYTFWFLFSDPGKVLYDTQPLALTPGQPVFSGAQNARQYEYVPPRTPPDWR